MLRAQQAIDSEYIFKHQRLRERQIRVVLSLASLNLGLLCIPLSLRESRGIRLGYVAGQQQLLDSGLALVIPLEFVVDLLSTLAPRTWDFHQGTL